MGRRPARRPRRASPRVWDLRLRAKSMQARRPAPRRPRTARSVLGLERGAPHAPLGRHVHAEPPRALELHALQPDAEDAGLGIAPEHDAGREVAARVQLRVHDDRQRAAVGPLAQQHYLPTGAVLHRAAESACGPPRRSDRRPAPSASERDGQPRHRAVEPGREPPARMAGHVLEHEGRPIRSDDFRTYAATSNSGLTSFVTWTSCPALFERVQIARKSDIDCPPDRGGGYRSKTSSEPVAVG